MSLGIIKCSNILCKSFKFFINKRKSHLVTKFQTSNDKIKNMNFK